MKHKKYSKIHIKKDAAKLLGLKRDACGVILEAVDDTTFAIKAFEGVGGVKKKRKRSKLKSPTKKEMAKEMKRVRPNLQLMHVHRGLIYLLMNHLNVIYEAADKSIVDQMTEIETLLKRKDSKVKKKRNNVFYVDFDKDTVH